MTHIKVKIDNKVVFDDELEEWMRRTPDEFRDALRPDASPQPHMKAILIAMADAVTTGRDVSIAVKTKLPPSGCKWSMPVLLIASPPSPS